MTKDTNHAEKCYWTIEIGLDYFKLDNPAVE